MEVGELRQAALWFKGNEQFQKAQLAIADIFETEAMEYNVQYGPLQFKVVDLPGPPEEGARVLVGESVVTSIATTQIDVMAFKKTVDPSEWKRMQRATLASYRKAFPGAPDLPEHNIDQLIASEGLKHIARTH